MLGKVVVEGEGGEGVEFEDPNLRNLVAEVSCKVRTCVTVYFCILLWIFLSLPSASQTPRLYNPSGSPHIVAVDCGMKNNQIRCLAMRGAAVKVVPWDYDFNQEEGEK